MSSLRGVNFKLSATNAAQPAFNSFNRGMASVKKAANSAQAPMKSWNAGLNAQRRMVQQFGFQMTDFATQVAGGQSAMLAFTQQGGQMLQFFGPAGAIMAALLAVFGSLAIAVTRSGVAINQLYPYLGALEDDFRGLVDVIGSVIGVFADMARFVVAHLDVIIIAASLVASFFLTKFVSAMVVAAFSTNALRAAMLATHMSFVLGGTSAAAMTVATITLSAAMNVLRVALMRLGIPLLVIGLAYLIERFVTLTRGAGGFGNAMRLLGSLVKSIFVGMGKVAQGLFNIMAGVAAAINGSFVKAFAEIAKAWDAVANGMAATWNAIAGSDFGKSLGFAIMGESNVAGKLNSAADSLFTTAVARIKQGGEQIKSSTEGIKDAWASLKAAIAAGDVNSALPDWGKGGDKDGKGGGKSPLKKLKDEADRIKKVFEDTASSISSSMMSAFQSLADGTASFGDAAKSILASILKKIIEILMTPVFNSIAGAITGGIQAGMGGVGLSFAGGGYTGNGSRSGGLDGQGGFMAMLHPRETVIDHTRGQSSGGGQSVVYSPQIDARGADAGAVARIENALIKANADFESRVIGTVNTARKRRML